MKYKPILISLVILFFNSSLAQSQNETQAAKNITYMEIGTNVIIASLSVNYERLFYSSATEKFHLYGRMGYGASAVLWGHGGWGGLGGLSMITGKANHHFELSAGAFLGYESATPNFPGELFVLPLLDLGYRYQKPGKGFLFRAKAGILSVGIGIGYAF